MPPPRAVALSCLLASGLGAAALATASPSLALPTQLADRALSSVPLASTSLPPVAVASARSSRSIVRRVNAFRRRHHRRPVRYSPALSRSSARQSRAMLAHDRFAHGSNRRMLRRFSPLGEVIAARPGWRPRVGATVRQWIDSPPHRSLLLQPSFRYAGGSPAYGRFGRRRYTTWTMHLGGN